MLYNAKLHQDDLGLNIKKSIRRSSNGASLINVSTEYGLSSSNLIKISFISCISGGNICDLPKAIGSCKAENRDIIMMLKLISVEDLNIVAVGVTIIISKRDEIVQLHAIKEEHPCTPHPGCPRPLPGICRGYIYDIVNGVKCFAGCTNPSCKKGSCPSSPPDLPCKSRCDLESDYQCPGDQLCCQERCCRDPILEPKTGYCPEDPKPRNCYIRNSECESDSQCEGKRKCCRFSCQKFCVDPKDEREVIMISNVEN
ncbi:unnamed protein product [Mytilus edulis]|uniref:WAP domain-containing protein n=1 Tax=Mytilus edulis TaxID=6550 RepID=A0A8S3RTC3_MYTED|nr:unnamed protein product [Mytilus edulis]